MFLLKKNSWRRGNLSYIRQVRDWQRFLRTQGFDIKVDGDFGDNSESATRGFQQRQGLPVDGMAGPDTFAAAEALGFGTDRHEPGDPGPAPNPGKLAGVKGIENCSRAFLDKVAAIAQRLGTDPNYLMAVISFESAGTFSPSVKNAAGSGATGLIQFMPSTARGLGTSTEELARMSAERQLDYVEKHYRPFRNRLSSLEDCYMAVLWPRAVGRANGYILLRRGTNAYRLNSGLDLNSNGTISKAEAAAMVRERLPADVDAPRPPLDPGPQGQVTLRKGNRGDSVQKMQQWLMRVNCLPLVHYNTGPGIFGNRTEAAVKLFQQERNHPVTGEITQELLNMLEKAAVKVRSPVPTGDLNAIATTLPDRGVGFRTYKREANGADQIGRRHVIDAIIHLGKKWHRIHPECPFQIGDISRKNGARWPNNEHRSHRKGVDVDVRPFRKDHLMKPTTCNSREYSQELSKDFVQLVKKEFPGTVIFFNDNQFVASRLAKLVSGHDNHLHLRFL